MSIKHKLFATAAALALICGTGAAAAITAGPAGAATPSCGNACINTYPQEYAGQTNNTPQFVVDVYRQGNKSGQPVILFRGSNADPAEDWTISDQGTVADFYAAGLVSSAFALHYGCNGFLTVTGSEIPCETGSLLPLHAPAAAPTATTTTTGGTVAIGKYCAVITYINAYGETTASPVSAAISTTTATSTLTVNSPPPSPAFPFTQPATGWNVYIAATSTTCSAPGLVFHQQNATALPIGTNYATATTPVTSGPQPPAVNTTGLSATGAVNDTAWELQYAPYGVDSGLCMGLASTAVSGEGVSLQPCGVSSKTVWAEDTFSNDASSVTLDGTTYWAAINGSDTNFSNPYVLTYPVNAYPTDYLTGNPHRPQLTVTNLQQFSQGASPDDSNQLWSAFPGDLP